MHAGPVSTRAGTACARTIHAGTIDLGDGLSEDVVRHARESFSRMLVHSTMEQARLGFGTTELRTAAHLAQGVDRLARHGLAAHGFRLGVGLPD